MKKLLCSLTLGFGLLMGAQAQNIQTVISGTTTVPAALSNLVNASVSAAYSKDVFLQAKFKLTGAGTSGVLFRVDSSADGSTWSNNSHNFWVAAAGTTEVVTSSAIQANAIPFFRVSMYNTNSAIVTNIVVTAVTKRGL